jgi:hypothetical protein
MVDISDQTNVVIDSDDVSFVDGLVKTVTLEARFDDVPVTSNSLVTF